MDYQREEPIMPDEPQAGPETQARLAEYRRFRQWSKMFIEVNDALSEARLATGPPKRWGA